MTVTTRGLDVPLASLVDLPASLLKDVGDLAVQMIRSRTERGISVDGGPFQPLSPAYADAKRKAGLSPVADLTVSGRMLNDMRASVVDKNTIEIRFVSRGGGSSGGTFIQRSRSVGAADKAYYHHEAGAGKSRVRRRFFDLSLAETATIASRIRAYLDKVR